MKAPLRFALFLVLTLLAVSGLAAAQDESNDPRSDPPSRVARLQFIEGQVSLQPGGVDEWVDASLNRPLTTADRVWTDRDSRAELTIASAALRMGSETSLTITNLNDNTAQIELDQGTLSLFVRYLNPGDIVEVDTPNFAYTVFKPGEYRFEVRPDADQSVISVRRGDGEATGDAGNAVGVFSGQEIVFSQGQSLSHTEPNRPGHDEFDGWSEVRERQEAESASLRYVAPGTIGYEDLDANGSWQPSPIYGTVWYPNVRPGWAPYREGHWAWVEPWGWTWVDDAPWGFAPFHYGRWAFVGNRWGWVPGPVGVRPVYAPALVAWVGGPSFGVSFRMAGGGVGWVALGWHDPFIPTYHVSPVYARNVNISNSRVVNVTVINNYYSTTNVTVRNTTVNNIQYENAKVSGAVVAVPSAAFASGKPVAKSAIAVPVGAVGRGSFVATANVAPAKEAVLGGHAPMAAPAHLVQPRQVVSKTPPPPRPLSFEQQRPLLEKSNGVPLSPQTRANLRASSPAPAAKGVQPAGNQPARNETGARPAVTNQPGGRPVIPPTPPANANQKAAGTPPVVNPTGNTHRPPVWTNDNVGHAPAANAPAPNAPTTNQGGQNQARDQTAAPARPVTPPPAQAHGVARPPAPAAREVAPVRPASPPPAPPRATVPPPQTKNPPPSKDNKEKDKDKGKDPKGH